MPTPTSGRVEGREIRIAEDATSLIDHASRVLGAIEDGNWHYAHDKLHGLIGAAEALKRQVDPQQRSEELRLTSGTRVWARLAEYSRHYWLGRAVFAERPVGPAA